MVIAVDLMLFWKSRQSEESEGGRMTESEIQGMIESYDFSCGNIESHIAQLKASIKEEQL